MNGEAGKGSHRRPTNPVHYQKGWQRMCHVCNTCEHYVGEDAPVNKHCKADVCDKPEGKMFRG